MRRLAFLICCLTALMYAAGAAEQTRFPVLQIAEAKTTKAFVPKGWVIEEEVRGDLNADGIPDVVLRLVEDKPIDENRVRALVVIRTAADGKLARMAVTDRLLYCSHCGGMLSDPKGGNVQVEVKKGVLIISQLSGSRHATQITDRFRYDAASERFQHIGHDVLTYDRVEGGSERESTNLLTGVKVTEKYRRGSSGKEAPIASTRDRVGAKKQFLEDINYADD